MLKAITCSYHLITLLVKIMIKKLILQEQIIQIDGKVIDPYKPNELNAVFKQG